MSNDGFEKAEDRREERLRQRREIRNKLRKDLLELKEVNPEYYFNDIDYFRDELSQLIEDWM